MLGKTTIMHRSRLPFDVEKATKSLIHDPHACTEANCLSCQHTIITIYHFHYVPIRRRRFRIAIQPASRTWLVPRLQCHSPTPTTPSSEQFGGKLCKFVRALDNVYFTPGDVHLILTRRSFGQSVRNIIP